MASYHTYCIKFYYKYAIRYKACPMIPAIHSFHLALHVAAMYRANCYNAKALYLTPNHLWFKSKLVINHKMMEFGRFHHGSFLKVFKFEWTMRRWWKPWMIGPSWKKCVRATCHREIYVLIRFNPPPDRITHQESSCWWIVQIRFADGHVCGRLPWLLADVRRPSPLWETLLPRLGSELYE